jgi:predicted HTH domain antitoxin
MKRQVYAAAAIAVSCKRKVVVETVHVELPAALIEAAKLRPPNVSREAAQLLALELFREEKVSLARAAELCGTALESFMDFAAEHGVPPLQYGPEDLQEDRRSFKELGL